MTALYAHCPELTGFLSRLSTDDDAPECVYYAAKRAYLEMFDPHPDPAPLRFLDRALEETGYLPPDYVLGTY